VGCVGFLETNSGKFKSRMESPKKGRIGGASLAKVGKQVGIGESEENKTKEGMGGGGGT